MKELLMDTQYDFINQAEKDFIIAFDRAITKAGYESNGIQPYVCLGRYKIEYSKANLKNKKYVARFYFRDHGIVFRLYFTNIDRHSKYIENAPAWIKDPFINHQGRCKQCDKSGGGIGRKGKCSFKKSYTIDHVHHEKCAGENYYFSNLDIARIPQYIALLGEFYPNKRSVSAQ